MEFPISHKLVFISIIAFIVFGCSKEDPHTVKEDLMDILQNKASWTLRSVAVPPNTATLEEQWVNFQLTVSSNAMSTYNHPNGAENIWPTGGWSMDENGTTITRSDGINMRILTLNETSFEVLFTIPEGTQINSRFMSLGGDYIFNLK